MTIEEVNALSDEELRIKVAELDGWTREYGDVSKGDDPEFFVWFHHGEEAGAPPDYLHDLNAMHEVEKVLDNGVDDSRYLNKLIEICEDSIYHTAVKSVRATAAQRAKAFVLTMTQKKAGE